MANDILKKSIEAQTGRASLFILGILFGGILIVNAYLADWIFEDKFYSAALALVGAILLGLPIIIHAAAHMYRGKMHMDELVALAVIAAIASMDYKAAGVVAFFLLLANLIETRTALGARATIESLVRLAPKKAHRLAPDGDGEMVDPLSLRAGDVIRVRPGDDIAADGEIISGQSSINQANVTGESLPVDKGVGDEVFSGTNNLSGAFDFRVTRAGTDTTLGKVQKLILEAEKTRIPIMRMIDRYAGWYTPTILMLAGVVLFFTRDMERAVTMLVVACPCAIILAVPTAMVASLSCAARLGILIKDVSSIELAKNLTAFVFDKTGTLTTGQLSVTRMMPADGVDGADLLSVAAAAEHRSRHPVARAVVAVADKARIALSDPSEFEEQAGRGVRATVDGRSVLVGRRAWIVEQGVDMQPLSDAKYDEPEGLSTLFVACDGRLMGWIGLEDRTRAEGRQAMGELRDLGVRELVMVTGDRWSVARRVAREMGCTEVQAEVLPADKLELVDALKRQGHRVAVVGDGVNDAPALAAGDMSIAMGAAGSDVAINSATVALLNNDLGRLGFLVRLSRKAAGVIHQNLLFGVVFVVALLVLAGLGVLWPVLGALLHMFAATFVVFNSARLVRFGEELHEAQGESPAVPQVRVEPVIAS
ncbi:MAG: cation-translocating P-type ATPase [Phycisphaerae bacterium]|jgi:Cd2+/Zn2+-exporting ATPase|nr:cation-translocating P-type ATPase [Phycisphaerae bacterium]MDP7637413.1 cation-translocating P-type ATPase [Phycisphaerae bacterium]